MIGKYSSYPLGIDLGTSYSSVRIWPGSIIPNEYGEHKIPTWIAFTDNGILIGEAAKTQAHKNLSNTIFDFLRLLGRKFDDQSVQEEIKGLPYKLEAGDDGEIVVVVNVNKEIKRYYLEELVALFLTKFKESAEKYLGSSIYGAVIAAPCYCGSIQFKALKNAGNKAGLYIMDILEESIAAGIAFSIRNKTAIIINIGGLTSQISVITNEEDKYTIKASSGTLKIGGENIDDKLVEHCAEEFQKSSGHDIRTNLRAMKRLRTQCERAKRAFINSDFIQIDVENIYEELDISIKLSKAKFEEINQDLFKTILDQYDFVLKTSGLEQSSINEVILAGGSCNIPKISEIVEKKFGKEPLCTKAPEDLVVNGAAMLAERRQQIETADRYCCCLPSDLKV